MVTQLTDQEARRLSGDGATTPPGQLFSTSEGDLGKGVYRPSRRAERLATQAVVNDDATPITEGVEKLLRELIAIDSQILAAMQLMEERGLRLERFILLGEK